MNQPELRQDLQWVQYLAGPEVYPPRDQSTVQAIVHMLPECERNVSLLDEWSSDCPDMLQYQMNAFNLSYPQQVIHDVARLVGCMLPYTAQRQKLFREEQEQETETQVQELANFFERAARTSRLPSGNPDSEVHPKSGTNRSTYPQDGTRPVACMANDPMFTSGGPPDKGLKTGTQGRRRLTQDLEGDEYDLDRLDATSSRINAGIDDDALCGTLFAATRSEKTPHAKIVSRCPSG
eukprot:scaffold723_cov363-Prasinococcus_capsulatus_cf.AAC.18